MFRRIQTLYNKNKHALGHKISKTLRRKLLQNPASKFLFGLSRRNVTPENWIFIVGNYNSGTTLLFDLLAAHPQVASLPTEAVLFTEVFSRGDELGWERNWLKIKDKISLPNMHQPERAKQLIQDLRPVWNKSKATFFLEKSITNIERMLWIDKNLPNVTFIGLVRDGYSSAEGICRKAKPKGSAAVEYGKDAYDFDFAAQQWSMANQNMLEYAEKVQKFKLFRYEELTANPELVFKNVLDFVGLSHQPYSFQGSTIAVDSRTYSLKNMNYKSFAALSPADFAAFNRVAGQTMIQLGYSLKQEA